MAWHGESLFVCSRLTSLLWSSKVICSKVNKKISRCCGDVMEVILD